MLTKKEKKQTKKQEKEETLHKEHQELKESLQRLSAEFQNYQKRTEKEKQDTKKRANEELLKKILPVIDNLELALTNNKETNDFSKGVEMIYSQLIEILDEEGLEQIKADKYDPNLHEVVLVEEGEKTEITQVLQKGYMYNGKVLRHAKVKISKGDKDE